MKLKAIALTILLVVTGAASAQERHITVAASPELVQSEFLRYLLPRFSLKTGVRTTPVELEHGIEADVLIGPEPSLGGGRPVLSGGEVLYFVRSVHEGSNTPVAGLVEGFISWIESDIGQRTIDSFVRDGAQLYFSAAAPTIVIEDRQFEGDSAEGERLSLALCGRCHVVGPMNRMKGIGSTPSFGMLRTLGDWEIRFQGFYLLKPHPSFTQIAGVTDPFDAFLPSPIAPIEMTVEELNAIIAYVSELEAADLGMPFAY